MKKILYSLLILISACFINACTDLEEELQGEYSRLPGSGGGNGGNGGGGGGGGGGGSVKASVDGAFSKLLGSSSTAGHGGYWSVQEITSDEVVVPTRGGDWFDGGVYVNLHRHEWLATNGQLNSTWEHQYDGIGECNNALIEPDVIADPNGVAQVRVLRAFFYYRLMDTFGSVKIVTTPLVDAPQSSRAEVFNFIESEILDAIQSGDLATDRGNGGNEM